MATTRVLTLGAAAALGLALTGGTAHAASGDPRPEPKPAASSQASVPGQDRARAARDEAARAAAAGLPTMPAEATPVRTAAAAGVTITSYNLAEQRMFGFTFTGLRSGDVVQVVWRTVLNPLGVTHFNVNRGPHPELGLGYWDSGHQPGWTTATVTVLRGGAPVASLELSNDKAVQIAATRNGAHFAFQLANTRPGDHMYVSWTLKDGGTDQYEGPAGEFTRHVPRWSTATIVVFEGTDRRALLAHPLTISSPASEE